MFFKKRVLKQALEANTLIHDALLMGVADRYIKEDGLGGDSYKLQLLGRALNWAIPNLNYNFENDLALVEDSEIRELLIKNENEIFEKGLEILNSDLVGDLATFYIVYELYLVEALGLEKNINQYPGIRRMQKFIFQSLEEIPSINAESFFRDYKRLFIDFNEVYGKYGKKLNSESIDQLFSLTSL